MGGCREKSEREGLIGRLVLSGGCRRIRRRVVQLHKPGDKPEVKGSCSPGAMLLLHLCWNFISIQHDSCESFTNRTGAAGSLQATYVIHASHILTVVWQ